jgi:hypothetical protein
MGKITASTSFGLGSEKASKGVFSKNHYASATPIPRDVQERIDALMMRRVAGNVYECPSTKDFWKVKGNQIVKLVGDEVSNGERIQAAPEDKPQAFLEHILDDLEF